MILSWIFPLVVQIIQSVSKQMFIGFIQRHAFLNAPENLKIPPVFAIQVCAAQTVQHLRGLWDRIF